MYTLSGCHLARSRSSRRLGGKKNNDGREGMFRRKDRMLAFWSRLIQAVLITVV